MYAGVTGGYAQVGIGEYNQVLFGVYLGDNRSVLRGNRTVPR